MDRFDLYTAAVLAAGKPPPGGVVSPGYKKWKYEALKVLVTSKGFHSKPDTVCPDTICHVLGSGDSAIHYRYASWAEFYHWVFGKRVGES